ncbi:MAG: hypothetical protein ACK4G4_08375 [Thermus sp.]|uniref:hypothetical protein n=1 Tax=Thermus sp. TaxID=275 RepID=UPI003919FD63
MRRVSVSQATAHLSPPLREVRKTARRLLFAHPLRTGEDLELARAWVAGRGPLPS